MYSIPKVRKCDMRFYISFTSEKLKNSTRLYSVLIPTRAVQHCVNKLMKMYEHWRNLQKKC